MQPLIVGSPTKLNIDNDWCKKCKLHQSATHPQIKGRGDYNSKFLILGEAPGKIEDDAGIPLIGKPGEFLQYYLNQKGVSCYITNAVLCRPKDGDYTRTPLPTEISCCYPFTIQTIREMLPKVVLCLGKIAFQQLVRVNANLEVIRGKVFYHPELNTYIIPTYHPTHILKMHDKMLVDRFSSDLDTAIETLKRPEPRRLSTIPKSLSDPIDIKDYLISAVTKPAIAVDLETSGLDARYDKITDISLCVEPGKGIHIKWEVIQEFLPELKNILISPSIEKVFHNASFDISFLASVGIEVTTPIFDTMLAYHTLTMSYEGGESRSLYKLKSMAWFLTSEGGYEEALLELGGITGVQGILKKKKEKPVIRQDSLFGIQTSTGNILDENNKKLQELATFVKDIKTNKIKKLGLTELQYYAAMDADVTYRIYKQLKIKIDKDFSFVYYEIIIPLMFELMILKMNGIKIDVPYIDNLIEENTVLAEKLRHKVITKAGKDFNLNSTDQMREFMYEVLKLPINEKFVTGKKKQPSTGEAALEFYSGKAPILKSVLEYRNIQKQTSTFLEGYKKLVDKDTERVYPEYQQTGTATGRLSCSTPNVQQIPRDNKIRNMIIPDVGCKLLVVDLSQIELRVLAFVSQDVAMMEAFKSGHDLHTYTACLMFNIELSKFDKKNPEHNERRTMSKVVNFGIVYGQTSRALAESLSISVDKAEAFMNRFFNSYPNVKKWINETRKFAREFGYVETLYGRRRNLPNVYSTDEGLREAALRQAVNTKIQSPAGDIAFMGLIRTGQWLRKERKKSKIIGTVHDSILVEAPEEEVEVVSKKVVECMTQNIPKISIPLVADLDILDRWRK